ncbi:MAG: glycosyl hydrolase, partial [Ferruginibacter sp.]
MLKKIFLTIGLGCFLIQANAQLKWPAITQTSKPWTRWWWEGSAVNAKDLTWNMEQYKAAGLGGVEITPIYGVYGYEKQFINFLSPKWMGEFDHTLKEAKRLGLGVDLANGTGWPFGGPWVADDDASKTIYYKAYTVNGGDELKEIIEYQQEVLVRTANNKPAGIDSILKPVSLNKNLQALALDQIIYPGKLPLQLLMAYSQKGDVLDITGKVDAGGKLIWTVPEGKWNLYAAFIGLHGKMVERAAPGGEGYAIDHFSAKASANYFKRFDEAFKAHDISYLRAFFNDSYEVDDARGQSNWTPLLFSEFKRRKGYDLKNYLPALFGKADADMNSRVLYDYRSTVDELLLEYFTEAWQKWSKTKGAMVRNQSHGSPANTLDLYSAVDIPETEGTDILRFKFASSAANVTGKALASSESATWLNEHFLSSWGDVKKAIDLFFLGGVNHIFYHGTAYSPKAAPWPGWLF